MCKSVREEDRGLGAVALFTTSSSTGVGGVDASTLMYAGGPAPVDLPEMPDYSLSV